MLIEVTTSVPWHALPPELADVLEPELPAVSREIVEAIGHEISEYARPLEGAFGRGVRTGVTEALHRFVNLVRDPTGEDEGGQQVYIALGRQEYREGRTLDALQSAYRVGARVAWRRLSRTGRAAGVDDETVAILAEAIFAYIDELSAESVEGYAQAQSEQAGERERARGQLVAALLGRAPVNADLGALVADAHWTLPRKAAAVACAVEHLPGLARRLGTDVLYAPHERLGCVVMPDPEGPGRREALRVAARNRQAAVGPEGTLEQLPRSWRLASRTLALAVGSDLVAADDHLADLILQEGAAAVDRIAERRLAAFEGLTPVARERMVRTALAYVQHQGNAAAMARALHVHPQTARYRVARLRDLVGSQLDDPQARFELEAVLRVWIRSQGEPL